jgi:hypothetical protein
MYVRLNLDKNGRINIQQLLSFGDPDGNETKQVWENIPLTGTGSMESLTPPVGLSCGLLAIEEEILDWNNQRKAIQTNYVSALSISKITDDANKTVRIDTFDKRFFNIKIEYIEFLKLMTSLLSKFKIVSIDVNGNVNNI